MNEDQVLAHEQSDHAYNYGTNDHDVINVIDDRPRGHFQGRIENMINSLKRRTGRIILPSKKSELHKELTDEQQIPEAPGSSKTPRQSIQRTHKGSWLKRAKDYLVLELRYARSFHKRRVCRAAGKKAENMSRQEQHVVAWLITDLAYALTKCGASAHSVEYNLTMLSVYYGVTSSFLITPYGIWITFYPHSTSAKGLKNTTEFVTIGGTECDVGKLSDLHDFMEDILGGTYANVQQAQDKLHEIINQPPRYESVIIRSIAFTIRVIIGVALLSGTRAEHIAGLISALLCVLLMEISRRMKSVGKNIVPLITSLIAGGIGLLVKYIFEKKYNLDTIDVLIAIEAGIFLILPDFEFVLSVSELNVMNVVSGSVRMVAAFVVALQCLFGALVSANLSQQLFGKNRDDVHREVFPVWISAVLLPIYIIGTMVDFHAPFYPIATIFAILNGYAAFFGSKYFSSFVGEAAGMFLASLAVGIIGNMYSFIAKKPNVMTIVIGVTLLVPGIVSNEAVRAMLETNPVTGISASVANILIISFSLAIGLIFSDWIMYFVSTYEYM
jgi:uncharacterized membrane protein YjjP (DUF1212 family)